MIDRKSEQGIAGLRVDAIDKDLVVKSSTGSAITNARGAFWIEIAESQIKKLLGDRNIVFMLRVFRDGGFAESTEDSDLWDRNNPDQEVIIKIRLEPAQPPTAAKPPKRANPPRPNIQHQPLVQTVRLFGSVARQDRLIAKSQTDSNGRFEIEYDQAEFGHTRSGYVVRAFDNYKGRVPVTLAVTAHPHQTGVRS